MKKISVAMLGFVGWFLSLSTGVGLGSGPARKSLTRTATRPAVVREVRLIQCLDGMAEVHVEGSARFHCRETGVQSTIRDSILLACYGDSIRCVKNRVRIEYGSESRDTLGPNDGLARLWPPSGSAAFVAVATRLALEREIFTIRAGAPRGDPGRVWWPIDGGACSALGSIVMWPDGTPHAIVELSAVALRPDGSEEPLMRKVIESGSGKRDSAALEGLIDDARRAGALQVRVSMKEGTGSWKNETVLLVPEGATDLLLEKELDLADRAGRALRTVDRALVWMKHGQWGPAVIELEDASAILGADPTRLACLAMARSRLGDGDGVAEAERRLDPKVKRVWRDRP